MPDKPTIAAVTRIIVCYNPSVVLDRTAAILATLRAADGNKAERKQPGIACSTLYGKLKKYGLKW